MITVFLSVLVAMLLLGITVQHQEVRDAYLMAEAIERRARWLADRVDQYEEEIRVRGGRWSFAKKMWTLQHIDQECN